VLSTLALTATVTALAAVGPAGVVSSASAAGCHRDGVSYKILGSGYKVWIGTNVYSIWTAGPATIGRTVSKAATAGSSHSSSDTVEGGISYGVVSAKYNHTWSRSTTTSSTRTSAWTYNITIPKGMTARARVFRTGWNFPARKTVTYKKSSTCPIISKSFRVRVNLPNRATGNNHYCIVRDAKPATKIMRTCSNT
jgi:hypothetical protein